MYNKYEINLEIILVRVNCPTNEGSMMLLLKANPEPEKAKQIYSKRKNKRALYISKNWVSEFDSNRILVQGQDFSYPVFHNNFVMMILIVMEKVSL